MMLVATLIAANLIGSAGCTVDESAPTALRLRDLDLNHFACKVQPMLAARCAMNTCHGQDQHALRIYSPGKLRLVEQPTLIGRDALLTWSELTANFASARGLAPVALRTDDTVLIHKPLAPALGGGEHKGGVIFRSGADPGLQALHAWLEGATLPGGCPLLDMVKANP